MAELKNKLKIKYLPVITEKPTIYLKDFDPSLKLIDYLSGIDLEGKKVIVSGKVVNDLNVKIKKTDEVIVTNDVNAPVVAAIVSLASAAWTFAAAHPFLAAAFLLVSAYSIYSFLTAPRVPAFNFSDSFDKGSPTYSWEGGRTIQEIGTPVPIVYGVHRCWGNIINQYQSTDGDKNYLHLLLLICEGPVSSIEDIKINDNPIQNFEGVTYETRLGTNDQSVISGFDDLHDVHDLNVKLEKNVSFVYTTVRTDVEAFELYFAFPQGLFSVGNNGSQQSWSISYKVEYRLDGNPTWTNIGTQNITASNRSNFRRIFRKDGLVAGKYHIRVTKTSENSTLSLIGDFHLIGVDEIRSESIAYVNSALLSIRALATNQLSGATPNISCVVNGKFVPRTISLEDVVLYLQFEGSEGSQDVIDSSDYSHPITVYNNFEITNDDPAVGEGCAHSKGTAYPDLDYIEIDGHSDLPFTQIGEKTLEVRVKFDDLLGAGGGWNSQRHIWHQGSTFPASTPSCHIVWVIDPTIPGGNSVVAFYASAGSSPIFGNQVTTPIFTTEANRWYNLAIVQNQGNIKIFIDGVLMVDETPSGSWIGAINETYPLYIANQNSRSFFIDEYIVTNYAKYTEDYTPSDFRILSNPIQCMEDLFINKRYGLGNYMSEADINEDQFAEMAEYCDELVGSGTFDEMDQEIMEERFRLDVVIDSQSRAMDLISSLASSFRGMPFYSQGKIHLTIDKPQDDPTQLFTMGNIIKDSFNQKWKSQKEIYNVIEVQFLDRDKDYSQESILVIDEEALETEDPIVNQIRLFVTRMSQAIREGRYALKVSRLIDRGIGFKSQINALVAQPGDRVDFSHDLPQVGYSGKVIAGSTTSTINIDREVTVESMKTYELMVRFKDDTIEKRTVTNSAGDHEAITVSPAFSQAPEYFDDYIFGEENILAQPIRIIAIERNNVDEITINGVEYNESVYLDEDIVIPETKYSSLVVSFPLIEGIALTEKVIKLDGNVIANNIEVWFRKPNLSNNPVYIYEKARVYLSSDNGASYNLVGETTGEHFVISDGILTDVTYKVKITAVMKNGQEGSLSAATATDITISSDTAFLFSVDAWTLHRDYIKSNVDVMRSNLFRSGYVRDTIVINTSDLWNELDGEDWDGLDLDDNAVEASGYLEQAKPINLGSVLGFKVSADFDYKNVDGGSIALHIALSDDGVTYTSFAAVNPSTIYEAQYIKTRLVFATTDTSHQFYLYGGNFLIYL